MKNKFTHNRRHIWRLILLPIMALVMVSSTFLPQVSVASAQAVDLGTAMAVSEAEQDQTSDTATAFTPSNNDSDAVGLGDNEHSSLPESDPAVPTPIHIVEATVNTSVPEEESNDTLGTATALPLTENPTGSGYLVGRGSGTIDPSPETEDWSFEALAGDIVSISVDTPESDLDPVVYLRDAAGSTLASDSWGGPGGDAFISHYTIASSGTYYARVYSQSSTTGSYQLRVDLARGIQMESDHSYSNDSISGADVLVLVQGAPGHMASTVAGTVMAPEGSHADEDLFSLGTLSGDVTVDLSTRLPSTSTLGAMVTLVDDTGTPLNDDDGNSFDGQFLATFDAEGIYYARVESSWSYGGNLYLLTRSSMYWTDAEAYAQSLGGHLVTINDQGEQDWLYETFNQFGDTWIGLTDETVEGTWVWSSGQNVTYTNWASGQPGSYDYACMISSTGMWDDRHDSYSYRGIIELEGAGSTEDTGPGPWAQYLLDVDIASLTPPTVTDVSELPAQGETTGAVIDKLTVTLSKDLDPDTVNAINLMVWHYNGHFYLITDNSMYWSDAETYAQSLGGHLVTVNDQGEQDWLYETFSRFGDTWIGLTDEAVEGTWVWSSGQPFIYDNWASGEPNTSSYDYAYMDGSTGMWYDHSGSSNYRGIIELEGPDSDGDLVPDVLDPYPTDPWNSWDLREAGADSTFDTPDDTIYRLTLSPEYTSGTEVGLFIQGGPLPDGHYRFTANSKLEDRAGNPLDGNGDGSGGDAYHHTFDVALPPNLTFEGPNNDTIATATVLPLTEDPAGSGFSMGRGLGSIQPSSDIDYWSFEALAGDIVSISVDTPDSGLYPVIYLYNAAGSSLASDSWGGPGNDALISHYSIASSGTYYVRVYSQSSTTGSYQLRVDLARGIQMESDHNYSNDSISGANTFALLVEGNQRSGTVAGTIMAAEENVDEDYFDLGIVQAGETILLSLRLPGASTLQPVIEIRDANGEVVEVEPYSTQTVVRANIESNGIYYAVVVALSGEGPYGQYLLDAVIAPTGTLEYADLAVTEFTTPISASSGETIHLSWTVSNLGNGSTYVNTWYDNVVLSTNEQYADPDDIQLTYVKRLGVLNAGGNYTVDTDVQLPLGMQGDYWIFLETDAVDNVFEYIYETNNILQSDSQVSIELTPYADLESGNVSIPLEVTWPEPITITWSVSNQGIGVTGDGSPLGTISHWTDHVVFSRNTIYGDTDDRLAADVPHVGALAPGESYNGTCTIETPSTLSGDYYVYVVADCEDDIYEYADTHSNVAISGDTITIRQWIIEPGTITEDTTWSGLLKIMGRVTISEGVTLTIEPGSILKFADVSGQLDVYGRLLALATSDEPIIFTSWKDDTAGGDSNDDGGLSSPVPGDWKGIWFYNPEEFSLLEGFDIRYACAAVCTGYWYTPPEGLIRLSHGILKNNEMALVARVAYAQLDAEDCLIIDNEEAIAGRNTAEITLRNCSIADNSYTGEGKFTIFTFENCIFAFNEASITGITSPTDLLVRNCLSYGADASAMIGYIGQETFDKNGNINADPLFINRSADNYELSAGSPCIDSGRGTGASASDILGRPRYDDLGIPNNGTGFPVYVDIGAFERQVDSQACDLAVIDVSSPDPLVVGAGENFLIEYTVANSGLVDCDCSWQDKVYLSADPYISADDTLLDTLAQSTILEAGDSYSVNVTGTAPSDSGPRYVLVHTNANKACAEAVKLNNIASSPCALALDVEPLALDVPVTGTLSPGQWVFYRFEGEPGNSVLFILDSDVASGSTGLYLRYCLPPTVREYDVAVAIPGRPDQEARLLEPLSGMYYVGIYGQHLPGGLTGYTLTAQLTELDIRDVIPDSVGDAGQTTLEIIGDSFSPDDEFHLLAPDGITEISPLAVHYSDPSTVFTTFNFTGTDLGDYDIVVVTAESEIATLPDALTVTTGIEPDFEASLSMPGAARPGRVINIPVEYTNTGNVDIDSPMLMFDSNNPDCRWQVEGDDEWIEGPDFNILALSSDEPITVLRPGQTCSINIKLGVPFEPGRIEVQLSSIGAVPTDGSSDPIDWVEVENQIRPECPECVDWDVVFAHLQAQIGDTWFDYVSALRENAERFFAAGKLVYSARELFNMELDKAYDRPTGIIGGRVIESNSGHPLPHTVVSAWNTEFENYAESLTDDNGAFLLYGLDVGECQISVSGHLILSEQTLILAPAEDLLGVQVIATEAGHIQGFVTDADEGTPLANALISVVGVAGNATYFSISDSHGHYELGELPSGTYILECEVAGYVDLIEETVYVTLGSTTVVNPTMSAGGIITGSVVNSNGSTPIEDAYVLATSEDYSPLADNTDGLGEYAIVGVSSGNWSVLAMAEGWVPSQEAEVAVKGPNSVMHNFVLVPGATITGSVTNLEGHPIEGVTVKAVGDAGVSITQTDEAGSYLINSLAAGTYSIETSSDGYVAQLIFDQVLAEGESLSNVDFSLSLGKVVQGIILEADGVTPIEGAEIYIDGGATRTRLCTTGCDGTFIVSTLEPGVYLFQAAASGKITHHHMVEVPNLGSLPLLRVCLTDGGSISGSVTQGGGAAPLADELVMCFRHDVLMSTTLTGSDGAYVMNGLPSATYTISVFDEKRGFEPTEVIVDAPNHVIVNIVSGTGILRGTVTNASTGLPVEDAQVMAALRNQGNTTPRDFIAFTDLLGRYHFDSLLEGSYWIGITAENLARGSAIVTVTPVSGETVADFALTQAVDVYGTVINANTAGAVKDAMVWLKSIGAPNDDPGLAAFSDENGIYTIPNVAAGDYSIYCQAEGYVWATEPTVSISSLGLMRDWSLLPSGAQVAGQLIDGASHLPLGGWGIALYGPDFLLYTCTDSAGHYTFDTVPIGTWQVIVSRLGNSTAETIVVNSLSDQIEQNLTFNLISSHACTDDSSGQLAGASQQEVALLKTQLTLENQHIVGSSPGNLSLRSPMMINQNPPWPHAPTPAECGKYENQYNNLWNWSERLNSKRGELQNKISDINRWETAMHDAYAWYKKECIEARDAAWGCIPVFGEFRTLWREILRLFREPEPDVTLIDELLKVIPMGSCIQLDRHTRASLRYWEEYCRIKYTKLPALIDEYNEMLEGYMYDLRAYENSLKYYEMYNGEKCEDKEPDTDNGNGEDNGGTDVVTSISPEDKFGPAGYDAPGTFLGDELHYISASRASQTFDYRIEIWNKPDAPAPTQDATIDDVLDPDIFDLSTFEFTRVGFLKWDVPLPGGQAIDTRVDCSADMNIAVDITGEFNPDTGEIHWWFHCVDPLTGEYPEDPMAGFLPPYNPETGFEIGWMEFRVKPKLELPNGTQIANQAFVQFDFYGPIGPAPKEGPWINTIDSEPPSSEVADLPPTVESTSFIVSWNGTDDSLGSGIGSYDIYYSDNGGDFEPWILGANSTTTEAVFTGGCSHTYGFYSIATDNVGNVEDAPIEADATTTVISTGGITLNLTAGWNMVSVPLRLADNSTSAVFPGVAGVFTWNATSRDYYVPTVIDPEKGYWVAVTENTTITINGTAVETWTTNIKAGWNMIGSVIAVVSIADPNDDPDGSVIPTAYWWDPESKGYILTPNIEPGKGYWIASVNNCTLTLP